MEARVRYSLSALRIAMLALAPGLTIAWAPCRAEAQTADCPTGEFVETEVVGAIERMYAAAKIDDMAGFAAAVSPGFYAYDSGNELTAPTLMALMKAAHAAGKVYEWRVTQPRVRLSCDTAWVSYVNLGAVTDENGRQPLKWLESAALSHDARGWRVDFLHSTRVAAAEPAQAAMPMPMPVPVPVQVPAPAPATVTGHGADEAEIFALRAENNRAIARHDLAAFTPMFADDAVFVWSNGSSATGKAALERFFALDFADPAFVTYIRTPGRISVNDRSERAAEHGTWIAIKREARGETRYGGDYLAHWFRGRTGWMVRGEVYVKLYCGGPLCVP